MRTLSILLFISIISGCAHMHPSRKIANYLSSPNAEKMVHHTFKILLVKNLWKHFNDNDRMKIYLSESCKRLMLNKYPIHSYVIEASEKNHSEDAMDICESVNLKSLDQYIDQKVMSEALLALKEIMPDESESIAAHVCERLARPIEECNILANEESQGISAWLGRAYEKSKEIHDKPFAVSIEKGLRIIFDEKTFNPEKKADLTKDELYAVNYYSGSQYDDFNDCLRKNKCTERSVKLIKDLKSFLHKLDNTESEEIVIFRGTSDVPGFIVENLNAESTDAFVLDKAFTSTSSDIDIAEGFTGVGFHKDRRFLYMLKAKSCVALSNMVKMDDEDELICPPGMKVRSKKLHPTNKYGNIYLLEESVE